MEDQIKTVVVFDFDGVICKNADKMIPLSAEILEYHFAKYGIHGEIAKELAYKLYYYGADLHTILYSISPSIKKTAIDNALADFYNKAETEVYDKSYLSVFMATLMKNLYINPKVEIYISSLTKESMIKRFLQRHGMARFVKKIYAHETGRKDVHIKEIKKQHPHAKTIFITDGVHDATQAVDIVIGIVEDKNKEREELFRQNAGNKKICYIFNSMHQIEPILQEACLIK